MSNLCRFCIMAAILDFRALEREKMTPYFFLYLYHILTESGEFLLLPKKYTNLYFMTNEPTLVNLCACIVSSAFLKRWRGVVTSAPTCRTADVGWRTTHSVAERTRLGIRIRQPGELSQPRSVKFACASCFQCRWKDVADRWRPGFC